MKRILGVLVAFACAVICGTAVNFLAKRAALSEPPIALNGWRTLTAAVILFVPMICMRSQFRLSAKEFRWYIVLASLTMALPQAMIFLGLRRYGVVETTAAFIEAAVLGIVIVYLFGSGSKIGMGPVLCAAAILFGLAVFLGIRPGSFTLGTGDMLVVAAALATGAGLIVAERIEPPAGKMSLAAKARRSTKKTFYACLIAGGGTGLILAVINILPQNVREQLPAFDSWTQQQFPAGDSWLWIVVLAVVGSCLTWFSVFLLIAFEELILAAAAIAAVPVATEIANYLWFKPTVTSIEQWLGGLTVLGALAGLIWLQLIHASQESAH